MSRISDGEKHAAFIALLTVTALLGSACKWTEELEGRNANRRGNTLFREMQFIDSAAEYERALKQVTGGEDRPIIHYNLGLAYSKMYRPGYDKPIRLGEVSDPICQVIPDTNKAEPPVSVCIKRPGETDQRDTRRFADCDEMTEVASQLANKQLPEAKKQELEQRLEQLEAEEDAQWDALEQQLTDKQLTAEKRLELEDKLEELAAPKLVDICSSSFECKKASLCTASSAQLANLAAVNLEAWIKAQPSDESLAAELKRVLKEQDAVHEQHKKRIEPIREAMKAKQPAYEERLNKLRVEHEQNLARIRDQQKAGQAALDQRLARLRTEHEQKLAKIREAMKAGQAAHDQRLAELRADHEKNRMAQLLADHAKRLARIKDKHARRLAKIPPAPTEPAAEDPYKGPRDRAIRRQKNAEEKELQRHKNAEGKELQRYKAAETQEIQAFKDPESKEVLRYKEAESRELTEFKGAETKEVQRYKEVEGKETQVFRAAESRELERYKQELEPLAKRVDALTLKDDTRKQMTQAWIDTDQHKKALTYWEGELAAKQSNPKAVPEIMSTIAGIHLKDLNRKEVEDLEEKLKAEGLTDQARQEIVKQIGELRNAHWRKSIEWFHKVADAEEDPAQKVAALNSIGNIAWSKLNSKALDIEESIELADHGLGALQKATLIQPKLAKLYGLQASILNFRSLTHGASFAAAIDRSSAQDLLRLTRVLVQEAKQQQGQAPTPAPAPAPTTPAPTTPSPTAPSPAPASPSTPGSTPGGQAPKTGG